MFSKENMSANSIAVACLSTGSTTNFLSTVQVQL